MTRSFLLVLAVFSSPAAYSQSNSVTLTLTPDNNGADTRFTWSYTGSPVISPNSTVPSDSFSFISGLEGSAKAFGSPPASITGINTGWVLTNTRTGQTSQLAEFHFGAGDTIAFISMTWANSSTTPGLSSQAGDQIVLSGPTSGSLLSGIAFSTFQVGTWPTTQSIYNFDSILVVSGTPVPEPSTYGMILGGLALAGAALRRRRKA
jgi:hypothetical protein